MGLLRKVPVRTYVAPVQAVPGIPEATVCPTPVPDGDDGISFGGGGPGNGGGGSGNNGGDSGSDRDCYTVPGTLVCDEEFVSPSQPPVLTNCRWVGSQEICNG